MGMGMGGFGFGGGRNPRLRALRLGALVFIVLAGLLLHDSGRTYDTLRSVYLVLVIGLLVFSFSARRQGAGRVGGGSPWGGPTGGGWGRQRGTGWGGAPSAPPSGTTIDVPVAKPAPDEPGDPPA